MIVATLALCLLAFIFTRGAFPAPVKVKRDEGTKGRLYTFVVDPLTMLVIGIVATLLALVKGKGTRLSWKQFQRRKLILDLFLLGFLAVFWTLEVLTYFDVMGHPFDPAKTGNDFMWNGYLDWLIGPIVDTTVPTYRSIPMNILAAALLMLQLPCLLLGRRLGFMTAYFNDLDNWSRPKPQ